MSKSLKDVVPAGHIYMRDNVLRKESLTGVNESRAAWAKDLALPQRGEYTFFAGCGYQHMKYAEGMMEALKSAGKMGLGIESLMGIGKAFSKMGVDLASFAARVKASKEDPYTGALIKSVRVLRRLDVDFGYLQEEEPCCGSPLYYTGFETEYATHAEKSYEKFKSLGVNKVIGLVPACTAALKNVYPKYIEGYDLEVSHFYEIVARRLREKGKKPRLKERVVAVYHEPCQLTRYLNVIDEPQQILESIEGLDLKKLDGEQCGQLSTCCGGGGLEVSFPELSERVGKRRMQELLQTGAPLIVSSCPACVMQLRQSAKKLKVDVQVKDVVDILDAVLEE
jgi:Fe-S oxidoreductase